MSSQPALAYPLPNTQTTSPTTHPQPTNPQFTPSTDPTPETKYLKSLLSRTLRVSTSDARLFLGELKCTDREGNVILGRCFEYRIPPPPPLASPLPARSATREVEDEGSGKDVGRTGADEKGVEAGNGAGGKVRREMKSERYIGLVVIPGRYIRKIEVEEFESQTRGGSVFAERMI